MASNKEWYNSLSESEKELLKAKRRLGLKKGSEKAASVNTTRTAARLANIQSFPWEELTGAEKRFRIFTDQGKLCALCGIPETWNNKPLKFDLDHIDGNREDNTRSNLRLICPNCHSQTDTYKVGNNKNPGKKTYTDQDIIQSLLVNSSGYQAMKSLGMNPHGGNYTRVRKIIKDYKLQLSYTV